MTAVRIYQPSKSTMQAGKGRGNVWLVAFEPKTSFEADPVMGWIGSTDMNQEVHLSFSSLEKAIAFAKARGFAYAVCNPPQVKLKPKSYACKFGLKGSQVSKLHSIGRESH